MLKILEKTTEFEELISCCAWVAASIVTKVWPVWCIWSSFNMSEWYRKHRNI